MSNTDTDSCPDDNREERENSDAAEVPSAKQDKAETTVGTPEQVYPKVTDPIVSQMLRESERVVEINTLYHQADNDVHPVLKRNRLIEMLSYDNHLKVTHDDKCFRKASYPSDKCVVRNYAHAGNVPISFLSTISDQAWEEGWDEMAWEMALAGEFRLQPMEVLALRDRDGLLRCADGWFYNLLGFDIERTDTIQAMQKCHAKGYGYSARIARQDLHISNCKPWKGLITEVELVSSFNIRGENPNTEELLRICKLQVTRPKLRRVIIRLICDYARLLEYHAVRIHRECLNNEEKIELGFSDRFDESDYVWLEKRMDRSMSWGYADNDNPELRNPIHR